MSFAKERDASGGLREGFDDDEGLRRGLFFID